MSTNTARPHRRLNALTGDWVLVSPHRTQRPWQGQREAPSSDLRPEYDPECYLCPGNQRSGGLKNPLYTGTHVFVNDFAALLPEEENAPLEPEGGGLFHHQPVNGVCRVICFSPRHNMTLPDLDLPEIEQVVAVWIDQTHELGESYRWVQIFENKGAIMGCSNPHPHGQVWASSFVPNEPAKEDGRQRAWFDRHGEPLLLAYLQSELEKCERVVVETAEWVAVVPYWAVWPFETLLLPKRHAPRLTYLDYAQRSDLAVVLKTLLTGFDRLFGTSFPYSMGWHGAPFTADAVEPWQVHAHFFPPLLRSADVKKFMVGFELLAEAQRDLTPELAAERLREVMPSSSAPAR